VRGVLKKPATEIKSDLQQTAREL